MAIEVSPLHPTLGAEVRRVDLTRPVPPEIFAEIEAAFNRHGILVFPEQPVTDEQQLAFSQLFGPLEVNPNYAGAKMRLRPDIADISNLDPTGARAGTIAATCSTSAQLWSGTPTAQARSREMLSAFGARASVIRLIFWKMRGGPGLISSGVATGCFGSESCAKRV